ncbi:MinD-like ATPase involved in chromosome partitioning or flagellar assembly [Agromyces terreus]|uniref:MinD-like ATPase involved in chromosome partitioning or flagellar assembly n=1 Tax=Agromyces terreus TaxID=424795 RepID=A0A9X2H5V1_9MICO|nr:regulator [Agromyces terreus]MCP2371357.1 MinD-like ATPase involved in chromosome partitioning or flagellar assembly [Agromyces terreus]
MARLAFAVEPSVEDRLLADAVEAGHVVVARAMVRAELIEALDVVAPDVVLAGAGRAMLDAELLEACDLRGIRLVALAASDAERSHARAIGLHEVFDAGSAWADLEAAVSGGVTLPSRVSGEASRAGEHSNGAVIAVWGPGGAPGRTTIAVNLAAEIAAAGHRVALIDADPYGGAVAPTLGLLDEAPGFASACRLAGADALDRAELERIAQRYSSPRASFDVFTGLVGPNRWPELARDRVGTAIAKIREWVEYVVIDTGFSLEHDEELTSDQFAPRRNAATFTSLAKADHVVAVGLADPVGLSRLLRGHAELVDLVDADRISVVVNRVRTSALGIDAYGQVRQTMRRFSGLSEVTMLPHDGRATDAAILTARTLRDASPKSPLRAAVREFAHEAFLPVPAADERRRRRVRRARRSAVAAAAV